MNFKEKDKLLMDLEEKSYAEDFDEKAEQILLRLTKDKKWLVRADACDSLCISKSVETYNLLESMAKKDTSGCVREYAVLSLGEIANRIHRKSELTKIVDDSNKDVILKALMEQKDIETIDSIISEIEELIEDIESGHCE